MKVLWSSFEQMESVSLFNSVCNITVFFRCNKRLNQRISFTYFPIIRTTEIFQYLVPLFSQQNKCSNRRSCSFLIPMESNRTCTRLLFIFQKTSYILSVSLSDSRNYISWFRKIQNTRYCSHRSIDCNGIWYRFSSSLESSNKRSSNLLKFHLVANIVPYSAQNCNPFRVWELTFNLYTMIINYPCKKRRNSGYQQELTSGLL